MRYLIFAGEDYRPSGASDYITGTDSLKYANELCNYIIGIEVPKGFFEQFEWAEILDLKTGKAMEPEEPHWNRPVILHDNHVKHLIKIKVGEQTKRNIIRLKELGML